MPLRKLPASVHFRNVPLLSCRAGLRGKQGIKPAVLCEKGGSGNNRCARLHSGEAAERDVFAPSFCLGATRPETENEAFACSD